MGSLVQALNPAIAAEAAISFSTSRRLMPSEWLLVRDSASRGTRFVLEELAVFRRSGQLLEALPEASCRPHAASFARAAAKSIEFVSV